MEPGNIMRWCDRSVHREIKAPQNHLLHLTYIEVEMQWNDSFDCEHVLYLVFKFALKLYLIRRALASIQSLLSARHPTPHMFLLPTHVLSMYISEQKPTGTPLIPVFMTGEHSFLNHSMCSSSIRSMKVCSFLMGFQVSNVYSLSKFLLFWVTMVTTQWYFILLKFQSKHQFSLGLLSFRKITPHVKFWDILRPFCNWYTIIFSKTF